MMSEAVDAAFGMLAQTEQPHGGRTVEGLVTELIRPMLKTWLDDNLPALSERLVRAEVERVSRAKRLNADGQEDRLALLRDMPPAPPRDLSPQEAEIWRATVDGMKAQDLLISTSSARRSTSWTRGPLAALKKPRILRSTKLRLLPSAPSVNSWPDPSPCGKGAHLIEDNRRLHLGRLALLSGQPEGKFAIANAYGETLGKTRRHLLAVGRYEFGKGGE